VITIVSGLPRSGTSLMMQMLAAGGMTLLTDFERQPDVDNPRGYCEWEPAKKLPKEPQLIAEAEGKAVKVISQLLLAIPQGHEYKVIFMERPLPEVLASQDEMLRRRGKTDSVPHDAMTNAFMEHFRAVNAWFKKRPDVAKLPIAYNKVLQDPTAIAEAIKDFLKLDLNLEAMVAQVDPSLYRNRKPAPQP
jgi:LPS sulfotransferase NodH